MSTLETVRSDLENAVATLDDLRDAMRRGEEVDLDAFNLMVAHTCKAAVQLPQSDAPKVRPQLERLLSRLNDVRAEIEAERQDIAAQLDAANAAHTEADGN